MIELIRRLVELESDVHYKEPPTDDEPEFRFVPGQVPVLLSAPHGAVHERLGQFKEEDEYTAGIACLVAELTDAHVLYARRKSGTDPNWYQDVPYKQRLGQVIDKAGIRFVLDLHGAAAKWDFGIALGTMNGESCPEQRENIINRLEESGFRRNGSCLERLDVDKAFTGSGRRGQETIIKYTWKKLGVPAAQFEIHPCLRVVERREDATQSQPFRGGPEKIEKTIRALVDLVHIVGGITMNNPKHAWMVRAGDSNELADQVEDKNAVAVGWWEMGDLSDLKTREQFKQRYQEAFPEDSQSRTNVNTGQVYRFACEIREGNYVLTYDKASRELLIGLMEGPYEHAPNVFSDRYPHVRKVKWLKRVSRDSFSAPARNSLGSTLTVFRVDNHLAEIHRKVTAAEEVPPGTEEGVDEPPFFAEVKAKADELIADLISHLDPYDFQDLVAGVLRAMGFRAVSTEPGPDRGVDIIAHRDPFGFERPLIKVQVKHRKGAVGGPDVRSFLGTLREGDNGLYISTGGFTKEAMLEAERVTLLDRDAFILLLLEHYEALEPEYKAQVPLRKVWVPAE